MICSPTLMIAPPRIDGSIFWKSCTVLPVMRDNSAASRPIVASSSCQGRGHFTADLLARRRGESAEFLDDRLQTTGAVLSLRVRAR